MDPVLARMLAIYDEVCLQTFPIDAGVDKLMASKGAKAMTPDEVRITLKDDPGRAWQIADGDKIVQVTIEMPPYHACSVRRFLTTMPADMRAYRVMADRFEAAHPGFASIRPYDTDMGVLHVHAVGEQRSLPTGGAEALFIYDQHVIDPARRAKGETAINLRFVHQIADPEAK